MYTRKTIASLLILIGALASGCSSNPADAPTTQSTPRPGPGSAFTYHDVHTADDGSTISDSTMSYVVLDTGIAFAGHTNVTRIVNAAASDTVAFHYTSKGIAMHRPRIEIFQGVALPEVWASIDTTDASTHTLYVQRDTANYMGTALYFYSHAELVPQSDTVLSIGTKSYTAFRWMTRSSVTVTVAITGDVSTTVVEGTRAFAPEVGFIVSDKTVVTGATAQSPIPNGTELATLTTFTRK